MCICILAVYYWQVAKEERVSEEKKRPAFRTYAMIIIVAMSLFALTTIMNGRVSNNGSIIGAITKRIFSDNQSTAVQAFRFVNTEPCQFGRDWLLTLRKVLPGSVSYTTLATRVFAIMKGSTAGTAPPCIWTSAYYNFGYIGVLLLSSILGVATAKMHYRYSKKACDEFTIIMYAGKVFLLGYWIIDGPVTLVNNGFVALCLLDYIMNRFAFRVRLTVKR